MVQAVRDDDSGAIAQQFVHGALDTLLGRRSSRDEALQITRPGSRRKTRANASNLRLTRHKRAPNSISYQAHPECGNHSLSSGQR